jgi:hypothetical protein
MVVLKKPFLGWRTNYEVRLKSSWTRHITPRRNFVEVRWRSLFRSTSLLRTLHPFLENVLKTVDHFEISCLGPPFSWLEKPRNRMGRDLNWILCSAWKKWIGGTPQEYPPYIRLLWNKKLHYHVHKTPPPSTLVSILSQISPAHTFPPYFPKIHSNIIRTSTPTSTKWCLPLRFSVQNFASVSDLSHECYMPHPSHPSWSDHPFWSQVMMFLVI